MYTPFITSNHQLFEDTNLVKLEQKVARWILHNTPKEGWQNFRTRAHFFGEVKKFNIFWDNQA